jgi:glucuronate isomerase
MLHDLLAQDLYTAICHIPLIDTHSRLDPRRPVARGLEEILCCPDCTELACSAGMDPEAVAAAVEPRERVRAVLYHMSQFDNTAPYQWFLEFTRAFLNFQGARLGLADATPLYKAAAKLMGQPDWEEEVLRTSNLEKVFVTNDLDDPLEGFDTNRYVPCLGADELVFRLDQPEVRQRLAQATGTEVGDLPSLRRAVTALFEHFTRHDAKACTVSFPPDLAPAADREVADALATTPRPDGDASGRSVLIRAAFRTVVEHCREFKLPLQLLCGVDFDAYPTGGPAGQDQGSRRPLLTRYAELFNAFPEVTFCVSLVTGGQNQELARSSRTFANVVTCSHGWDANVPAYLELDVRAQLQTVPKTKQIGYSSGMYKLEFALPKFNMYRRILAQILADDFVRPHLYTEQQALELARLLLRDNARRVFNV